MKIYGSDICIDCRILKAVLMARGIEADFIDITENTGNLREFLGIRDHDSHFEKVRNWEGGAIGIPCFVSDEGSVTLNVDEAFSWIGQPCMNPMAVLAMENGAELILELLPQAAPNTVNSFIQAAQQQVFDRHGIERIVPKDWIDMSYSGFGKKEGQYLIPYESELHPEIPPLDSHFGCVCMGGYGKMGQAGCEFFFPLRPCPEHKGLYPVFGKVISGIEEILRLEHVAIRPVTDFPIEGLEVNTPVEPEIIDHVELDLKGVTYPDPVRINEGVLTPPWKQFWER